jgi:PEP-CTERM/exosortase A-associated glycosyltransferase
VAEAEKPDLLHAHSPVFNGVAALKAGRKLGIPVVYEIRSLWEEAAVTHGTYAYRSREFNKARSLETWVCNRADHVVAISNGLRNHLAARGIPPDKISVVFNGIDLHATTPCTPDDSRKESWNLTGKNVIGYIGSFRRYEGLDLLIRAFANLSETRPNIVLLLVGGGRADVTRELEALVDKLHLRGKVIMPGWLPTEQIPGVYALIDVLVYPRVSLPLTNLVTPLKPLEAMAMGKALIASDVGGHRELIRTGHNGLLFRAGDEPALMEAISRLLDDRTLLHRLARQAADWVRQEHSWSKTTSVYSAVYGCLTQAFP